MTSKPVAALLAELDVTRTHSRPHVSNDNQYSGAAFKTLKYCPTFPEHFGSIQDARSFCVEFFESTTITTATAVFRCTHPRLDALRDRLMPCRSLVNGYSYCASP